MADKCTRELMTHSSVCSLYPKSKMTKCLREASQLFTQCIRDNTTGVSSGCGGGDGTSLGAQLYRKLDGRIYVNNCGEIPFNGKVWNGKCYAYYIDGEIKYFTDSFGNVCDNAGRLGNDDTSNGY